LDGTSASDEGSPSEGSSETVSKDGRDPASEDVQRVGPSTALAAEGGSEAVSRDGRDPASEDVQEAGLSTAMAVRTTRIV
jgi:hypothetical protein